jgi:hypothetical protein
MRCTKEALVCAVLILAVMACAPTRRSRISEGERLGDRAGALLDDAEKALNEMDADGAERKLREASHLFEDRRTTNSPDGALLLERYKSLEPRVAQIRAEKGRQEIAQRVAQRRAVLAKSVKAFRLAAVDLEANPADRARAEAARRAADQLEADLRWERDLQEKDPDFKNYVESLKIDVQNAHRQLALSQPAGEFAQGPARDHDDAQAIAASTKKDRTLDARLKHLQEARDRYLRCHQRAVSLMGAHPGLEKSRIYVSGRPSTAAAIARSCEAQAQSLEKRIASIEKSLAKRSAKKGSRKHRRASR